MKRIAVVAALVLLTGCGGAGGYLGMGAGLSFSTAKHPPQEELDCIDKMNEEKPGLVWRERYHTCWMQLHPNLTPVIDALE